MLDHSLEQIFGILVHTPTLDLERFELRQEVVNALAGTLMQTQELGASPLLVVSWQKEVLYFCLQVCPCGPGRWVRGRSWGDQRGDDKHGVGCHALVKTDLSPPTSLRAHEPREDSGCDRCVVSPIHHDLDPDLKFTPPFVELGGRTIERAGICDHLLACRRCWLRLCSRKGRDMVLEVDLSLNELSEECLQVCHSSDSVGVETGIGGRSLFNRSETRGPEGATVSEREVWQGQNRKGTVESEENLDLEVAGKATVGGNGSGELILLFKGGFSSDSFFAGDRARTVDDCQALLLCFDEVTGKVVRYGGKVRGDVEVRLYGTRSPQVFH